MMNALSSPLARLLQLSPTLRDRLDAIFGDLRSAADDAVDRALLPLLHDTAAMAELRALIYARGPAPLGVWRRGDRNILRAAATLIEREWPLLAPARQTVPSLRYVEADEPSVERLEALRFPTLELAAAFLGKLRQADPAGLAAMIGRIAARNPRPVTVGTAPADKAAADADELRHVATFLHRGDWAVCPAPGDARVFYFFRRRRMAGAAAPPVQSEAPPARVAAASPPLAAAAAPDFAPIPTPSGAAPATCDCLRNAAAGGVPFVAAA
jgi:hypothetical protein